MSEVLRYSIAFFIIFVFVVVPIWGVVSILKKTIKTRSEGRELDLIESNIVKHIQLLKSEDIASFDGVLSSWLDTVIDTLKTPWLKNALFMASDAKYIGLGEVHRNALINNDIYRNNVFNNLAKLAFSFGEGKSEKVLLYLAQLYSLFYCAQIGQKTITAKDASIMAFNALKKSVELYHAGDVVITEPISNALEEITTSCPRSESIGISILVLRWALHELDGRRPNVKRIQNLMKARVGTEFDIVLLSRCLLS